MMAGMGNEATSLRTDLLAAMELGNKVEPQIGDLVKRIKALIEEKRVNNEELKKLQARRGEMEKELDELNQEIFHLEGDFNTKEANLKRLHFQYDQSKAQTERQLDVSRESKQRIEALTAQIEEEKLKRKKERNTFEQQLEELISKHKWMAEFYTPARLELEMRNIENSEQQLLSEERTMLEKLGTLDKELDSLRQRGAASDEAVFLHSKEAKFTHQLFEEENKAVKRMFREVSECSSDLQQIPKLSRFLKEREAIVQGADGDTDDRQKEAWQP
ncbi:synaptonemal complex central element protein 1-like isoform X2 [Hemiscyllium ocellatum]|uniref:synaptonemal complex central element protein 1-like isoform X2 n=1 Tax=Hemiscyllium ocellatum TaxID=170820 RepID=UPI002965E07E|nr:synaptonemal complex central element protein 1-like isoform X2 [Hemiscyllium ocellatum]